jgi:hypothetical protein
MEDPSFHYTPVECAQALIALTPIEPGDSLLEPFKGGGAFYDHFPEGHAKDFCEIAEGRDFFTYQGQCDVIITNPPFWVTQPDGKRANVLVQCMDKCFEVATKTVGVFINAMCFNGLTPLRLEKWKAEGWVVTRIHIVNVKKWFGRYYYVVFQKGAESPWLSWNNHSY